MKKRKRSLKPPKPFSEEWIILKIMEQWTPEDVNSAIERNVSLVQPIVGLLENNGILSTIAKHLMTKHYDKLNMLTAENVLFWIENRREDIYRALTSNPKGVKWIRENVDGIREALLEKLNSRKTA